MEMLHLTARCTEGNFYLVDFIRFIPMLKP